MLLLSINQGLIKHIDQLIAWLWQHYSVNLRLDPIRWWMEGGSEWRRSKKGKGKQEQSSKDVRQGGWQSHTELFKKKSSNLKLFLKAKRKFCQNCATNISSLRAKTSSHFGSYTSFSCNQGQMRSITTVTISMTTSPAAIIGLVVKETEPCIMGCRPK